MEATKKLSVRFGPKAVILSSQGWRLILAQSGPSEATEFEAMKKNFGRVTINAYHFDEPTCPAHPQHK